TNMTTIPSMCRHPLVAFSSHFSKLKQSSKCSNPLHIHSVDGVKSRNLPKAGKRSISLELCEAIKCNRSDLHVYPGQKLCTTCIKQLVRLKNKEIVKKSNTSESELGEMEEAFANVFSDENEVFSPMRPMSLSNQVTSTLQVTPVNVDPKRSKERQTDVILKKTEKVKDAFLQLHEPLIGEDLLLRSKSTIGNWDFTSSDYKNLMDGIKKRCQDLKMRPESSIEIISHLTLAPISWSQQQISTFFGVSEHQVRRSAILKREKGLLAKPDKKQGRPITEDEKEIVRDFYLCDENSRQLPGMKDYVSVRTREGEKKQKVQKRLLLMNINELYVKYKEYCERTLCLKSCGRSTFFMLRPCNVIEVGSSGSHN
ncbi:Cc8L18.2-like protein, partial [Daphnia magna]